MRLLLDTHTFLWFIDGSPKLSILARHTIEDDANRSFLSIASLWEMAIKISLGKLSLAQPFSVLIPQQLALNGIELINITVEHATLIASLPFHHRDPFDRLFVVQAKVEEMPVVSGDAYFDLYGVRRLW